MGPAALEELITAFARLPGIGRKTAQRLAFHVVKNPREEAQALAQALLKAKDDLQHCPVCHNFTERGAEMCEVCRNPRRDRQLICVVEEASDVLVLERNQLMTGVYHVLGGVLSPMHLAHCAVERGAVQLDERDAVLGRLKAKIAERFGGRIPKTMDEMLTLRGVQRKTANVVLGNAYGVVEGIAVDTHVRRLAQRLGLSASGKPEEIEKNLMILVPRNNWFKTTYLLIEHGRAICTAKKPLCNVCPLSNICPSAFQFPQFAGQRRNAQQK